MQNAPKISSLLLLGVSLVAVGYLLRHLQNLNLGFSLQDDEEEDDFEYYY